MHLQPQSILAIVTMAAMLGACPSNKQPIELDTQLVVTTNSDVLGKRRLFVWNESLGTGSWPMPEETGTVDVPYFCHDEDENDMDADSNCDIEFAPGDLVWIQGEYNYDGNGVAESWFFQGIGNDFTSQVESVEFDGVEYPVFLQVNPDPDPGTCWCRPGFPDIWCRIVALE